MVSVELLVDGGRPMMLTDDVDSAITLVRQPSGIPCVVWLQVHDIKEATTVLDVSGREGTHHGSGSVAPSDRMLKHAPRRARARLGVSTCC